MRKFFEIAFVSLFCLLATASYQKEGEEQVISVNADGWASKARVLSEDELKEIDFTRISEIGYYIIDQFTSMRLFGATVYIDGDVFKDTQHLYVVNPLILLLGICRKQHKMQLAIGFEWRELKGFHVHLNRNEKF